ncbi:MAG: pyridoxal-phosphate-dependent aminotransferase family protein [bacterium]
MKKELLMLPGPTMLPPAVRQAATGPMINHRGKAFADLFRTVTAGLQSILRTEKEVLIFPAAGTGAMEAVIVNLFSPGDKVLVVEAGVFGSRFGRIAQTYGLAVETVPVEWGQAVNPDVIGERLNRDRTRAIKAVIITQNETSTGVTQDIRAVSAGRGRHPALLIVDAVSSLGAVELAADAWNIDVVLAGSQKALMTPPGLAFICLGDRAWAAAESASLPRYYWDLKAARAAAAKGQTPYTPAVSLLYGLQRALTMIAAEGVENVYRRHALLGRAIRAAVAAMGLELFADQRCASDTVTAVRVPEGVGVRELRQTLDAEFGVTVAGGQQALANKIIRIGHLGYVSLLDIVATAAALEMALARHAFAVSFGAGVGAAQKIFTGEEK